MFQSFSVNSPGVVSAQSIDSWLTQEAAAAGSKPIGGRDVNLSSYEVSSDEVSTFMLASANVPDSSGSVKKSTKTEIEMHRSI
jgi:hypothetical protein